jgi:hypothetical protein
MKVDVSGLDLAKLARWIDAEYVLASASLTLGTAGRFRKSPITLRASSFATSIRSKIATPGRGSYPIFPFPTNPSRTSSVRSVTRCGTSMTTDRTSAPRCTAIVGGIISVPARRKMMAVTTTTQSYTTRKFTTAEYHRMGEVGIFHEDDRVELIEGEIIQMTPIGDKH